MNVEVLLFARLREMVGQDRVTIQRQELLTVRDVWDGLRAQYPQVEGFGKSLIFSVNQEFAAWDTPVREGDELAFFPPVSGGAPSCHIGGSDTVIEIVRSPIRIEALVNQLQQPEDGAVVVFDGIVRNHSQGRKTLHLEYEGYEPMALKKMKEIEESVRQQWPVNRIGIVHRLGRLEIGEASVVIVVTSAHRKAAFEACQHAIDTLKKTVPIWKKEFFADGEVWVEGEVPPGCRYS
ncbi:MAG: molybdenum cofactor biosynthesis protein MoaE [Acidobacteria bacterium]|nr:molybdenum cofactor biosynthesis protein MoaE [Acidobacteriota bacterium]